MVWPHLEMFSAKKPSNMHSGGNAAKKTARALKKKKSQLSVQKARDLKYEMYHDDQDIHIKNDVVEKDVEENVYPDETNYTHEEFVCHRRVTITRWGCNYALDIDMEEKVQQTVNVVYSAIVPLLMGVQSMVLLNSPDGGGVVLPMPLNITNNEYLHVKYEHRRHGFTYGEPCGGHSAAAMWIFLVRDDDFYMIDSYQP
jgi:hypothetical protein